MSKAYARAAAASTEKPPRPLIGENCRDTAVRLLAAGFWPVPLYRPGVKRHGRDEPTKGKEPFGPAWGAERNTPDLLQTKFAHKDVGGVGIALGPGRGPGGGWLVDLEGDGPEAEASRAKLFGGEVLESFGWTATRGDHQLATLDEERWLPLAARLAGFEGKGEGRVGVYKFPEFPDLELRVGGYKPDRTVKQVQSACPPTPGTDGKPRAWNGVSATPPVPEAFYSALEAIATSHEPGEASPPPVPVVQPAGTVGRKPSPRAASVEDRAVAYLAKCEPAISGQRGHDKAFKAACRVGPGFDIPPDVTLRLLRDHFNPRCEPPWSDAELEHKVTDAFNVETRRGWLLHADRNGHQPSNGRGATPTAHRSLNATLADRPRTDMGNAERLVARHGSDIRFCHPWGQWLVWDGRRWKIDDTGEVERRAKRTARAILAEARSLDDDDRRKGHAAWALTSETRARLDAAVKLAASEVGIPILPEQMDPDPWAFNVRNGTIDLRTGVLKPHNRDDMITKLCDIVYDPSADCPLWAQTLEVFLKRDKPEDQAALIGYWQRLCGYALAGVIREHVMPIAYGTGSNGKSTILNALLDTFGPDYSMKCPPDLLMLKKTDSHPTDRADLFGKRLVVAIETEDGRRLNETLVKEMTGGDRIRARRMRENFWEFAPTHTLLMATNHKPVVRGTDRGIWRRIMLVPFTVSLDDQAADKTMPERLKAELPGILAWCVRGCLEWQQRGLDAPAEVTAATSVYRQDQDVIGAFLDECTIADRSVRVKAKDLYKRYSDWATSANENVANLRVFGTAIEERGIEKKTSNGVWYLGIGLRTTSDPEKTSGDYQLRSADPLEMDFGTVGTVGTEKQHDSPNGHTRGGLTPKVVPTVPTVPTLDLSGLPAVCLEGEV